MGRDLHHTIPVFLEEGFEKHEKVISWQRIDDLKNDNDFIYLIKRDIGLSDIIVHASDAYFYTLKDYFQKPNQLESGSFILIARPEAGYDWEVVKTAFESEISIGKFSALLGALNVEEHWNYIPPERREK